MKKQPSADNKLSTESIINPELHYKLKGQNSKISKNLLKMPNQKWHQIISFIKSGIRIGGYLLLLVNIPVAVTILVLSEVIGIIEELV
jgi:hypothetical protein